MVTITGWGVHLRDSHEWPPEPKQPPKDAKLVLAPSLPTGLDDDLGDPATSQNAAQIIADSVLPDYVKVSG